MSDLERLIEKGKIKVNDFIYYVAEEVYPKLSERAGVRRVRDRVSKALKRALSVATPHTIPIERKT
jgi:hypothetical protein